MLCTPKVLPRFCPRSSLIGESAVPAVGKNHFPSNADTTMRSVSVRRLAHVLCILVFFSAIVLLAWTGSIAATPSTPIDSEPDDSDSVGDRTVPSEQIPFGIRTTYGNDDLERPSGGSGVTVAVVDTGVDTDHPDLRERVTLCRDFTGETVKLNSCTDAHGHGTHVAGTVAADGGDDDRGIYGVAPEAELYAFKACGDDGSCSADSLASAVRAAVDEDADVIVLSLGGRPEPRIEAAVDYTTENDVVVVAAAGNSGPDIGSILYPAAQPNVISVGAVGYRDGERVDADNYRVPRFSARGVEGPFSSETDGSLDVAAPGVDVLSPIPGEDYGTKTGTSMAAPHAAGLVAKILSSPSSPETTEELRAELHDRAQRYDVTEGEHARDGYDPAAGFGVPTVVEPRAAFAVSPEIPTADEPFVLRANASRADSPIASYEWDTTDDGEFDRTGERIAVDKSPGTHRLTLRVTDSDTATGTVTRMLFVNDRPRVTVSVPDVRAGENATLEATVENEFGETTVVWTLPDGTTMTGETATHRFEPGNSTVEVTVTDEYGASSTETVTVTAAPEDQGPSVSPIVAVLAVLALAVLGKRR